MISLSFFVVGSVLRGCILVVLGLFILFVLVLVFLAAFFSIGWQREHRCLLESGNRFSCSRKRKKEKNILASL